MTYSSKRSALVAGHVRNNVSVFIPVPMLADSGADDNFITSKLADYLGALINSQVILEYVDGSSTRCRSLGNTSLVIQLHPSIIFRATFHVIANCPFDIVLGPALAIPRAVFDFHTRSLRFKGGVTVPSIDAFPSEVADLPLGHPTVAAFASGVYNDSDPDFIAESPIASVLEAPSAEELKALYEPGGDAPKQFPNVNPDLPPELRIPLTKLIQKYFKLGVWNKPCNDDRSRSSLPEFEVNLIPGARPVWQTQGRPVWSQLELIEKNVKQLLDNGLIEISTSPWSCGCFVVNGKRLGFNFKGINALTVDRKSVV